MTAPRVSGANEATPTGSPRRCCTSAAPSTACGSTAYPRQSGGARQRLRKGVVMGNINFDFAGRTVIVTGAARGIGLELARSFHEAQADVFMIDFDGDVLAKAAAELGARGIQADVSST